MHALIYHNLFHAHFSVYFRMHSIILCNHFIVAMRQLLVPLASFNIYILYIFPRNNN